MIYLEIYKESIIPSKTRYEVAPDSEKDPDIFRYSLKVLAGMISKLTLPSFQISPSSCTIKDIIAVDRREGYQLDL
jgi:hypothetical protein